MATWKGRCAATAVRREMTGTNRRPASPPLPPARPPTAHVHGPHAVLDAVGRIPALLHHCAGWAAKAATAAKSHVRATLAGALHSQTPCDRVFCLIRDASVTCDAAAWQRHTECAVGVTACVGQQVLKVSLDRAAAGEVAQCGLQPYVCVQPISPVQLRAKAQPAVAPPAAGNGVRFGPLRR